MLCTSNIDDINKILFISNSIKRRIEREIKLMQNKCDQFMLENKDNRDIIVLFKKNYNEYIFKIPSDYPFRAPKLNINGIDQNTFFNLKTNRFKNLLKYVSGLDCLCCNSYLCQNNWNPSITMERIIQEIEEYKTYKYWIGIKLISDKIKEKYLNRDIDLDGWLFNICDLHSCYHVKPNH